MRYLEIMKHLTRRDIIVNEHNDIDIICDSFENVAYVLNAKKVFNEEYRVHYKAMVGQGFANFDLRYIGDDYYFKQLEEDLLKTKIYNEKGFYTISNDYYFYTLLYHALLHKPSFSEDYKNRLSKMNKEFANRRKRTTIFRNVAKMVNTK